jgi:hypothetical protein
MSDGELPDLYEVYEQRIREFTDAVERVTVAAGFLVSRGDDTDDPYHTYINKNVRTFARNAFLIADRAQGLVAPRPWLRLRPSVVFGYERKYESVLAAIPTYYTALVTAKSRWGMRLAVIKEADGSLRAGHVYPDDFPGNSHSVRPRDLEMLRLTLALLKLPRGWGVATTGDSIMATPVAPKKGRGRPPVPDVKERRDLVEAVVKANPGMKNGEYCVLLRQQFGIDITISVLRKDLESRGISTRT